MDTCTAVRPNGKVYRARKEPTVHYYQGEWPDEETVIVLRVSKADREIAHALAVEEAAQQGASLVNSGWFGWWRESVRDSEYCFVNDDVSGVPGWIFNVE